MSKLVIVESPTKVKSVKKYLGTGYTVMASKGHIRDLPSKTISVDIEHGYKPNYIEMSDKKELIAELKNAAEKSDGVLLATDPDREGEAISWHLATVLGLDMESLNRVTFNEITKHGVETGMASPRKIDINLVDAQQARRVLDRIVGYKLSPFLWKKVKSGLSAGRVQTVALKFVVDREREIEKFVSEEFWTIDAKLHLKRTFKSSFYGNADGTKIDITTGEQANNILAEIDGKQFEVVNIKKGVRNKKPAPAFTTSTLQQEASKKLNFPGKRTMRIAQQLYEGVDLPGYGTTGLITYMRTDSLRISDEAQKMGNDYISSVYGDKYLPKTKRVFKAKSGAQDAHEAIRPTDVNLTPDELKDSLTAEQYKLYKLIWERFLACLMANCVQDTVTADIKVGDYLFKSTGYSVKFDGYTVLYEETKDNDEDEEENNNLPELNVGDSPKLKAVEPKQHFTQPPARYTESSLIKALDENGIGRPSTYVPIISNIIQRDYIEKEKKTYKPTQLGMVVVDLIAEYFKKVVDVKFTASVEESLDKIGSGDLDWVKAIDNFYLDFAEALKNAEASLNGKKVKVPVVETDVVCEKCGRKMVVKSGRFGKFLACPGFPECKNTKPVPEDEVTQPCPKCGSKLVKRISKKGKKFYGCSSYPNCDFAAPGIPTGEKCPECGGYIISGIRGRNYCMNGECPSRKPKEKKSKNEN